MLASHNHRGRGRGPTAHLVGVSAYRLGDHVLEPKKGGVSRVQNTLASPATRRLRQENHNFEVTMTSHSKTLTLSPSYTKTVLGETAISLRDVCVTQLRTEGVGGSPVRGWGCNHNFTTIGLMRCLRLLPSLGTRDSQKPHGERRDATPRSSSQTSVDISTMAIHKHTHKK